MINKIWNWVYPPRCLVCDRVLDVETEIVCERCRSLGLPERVREPICKCCGKPIGDKRREFCYDCANGKHSFLQVRSVFVYRGMEEAMFRFKDKNRRVLKEYFSLELAQVLQNVLPIWTPDVLMPIPLHAGKRRMRGYNQAELLAESLSKKTGILVNVSALVRTQRAVDQKRLSSVERRTNLRNAFALKEPQGLAGKRILLVDDVYTTGSTMDAAADILRKSGAQAVFFVTVCTGKGY